VDLSEDATGMDAEATEELDEDLEDLLVRILPLDTRELREARDASSSSADGGLNGADCALCLLTCCLSCSVGDVFGILGKPLLRDLEMPPEGGVAASAPSDASKPICICDKADSCNCFFISPLLNLTDEDFDFLGDDRDGSSFIAIVPVND
jgi:hypothetical protein